METKEQLQEKLSKLNEIKRNAELESEQLMSQIKQIEDANKPKPITELINNYDDVIKYLGSDESKDVIKIDKFDSDEMKVVHAFIQKMRISKAYREGNPLPKRNERRYYNWYDISSGFVFFHSYYADSFAYTASASRLCYLDSKKAEDAAIKFGYIDEAFIDLK